MPMLVIAFALFSVSPEQLLVGASFERFARHTDRLCPARRLRFITPGDLDWEQEGFEDALSRVQRTRLAAANRADKDCAGHNGLACQTTRTLDAMARTGMLTAFDRYSCAHVQPFG